MIKRDEKAEMVSERSNHERMDHDAHIQDDAQQGFQISIRMLGKHGLSDDDSQWLTGRREQGHKKAISTTRAKAPKSMLISGYKVHSFNSYKVVS